MGCTDMPLDEGQVQLRDLVMGPGTEHRFATPFNPFARNVRADQGGVRAWGDGAWSGAEWAEQVAVPMRLVGIGGGPAGWVGRQQQLAAAFAPSHEDLELRFVMGGTEFVMFGRPRLVDPEARFLDGTGYCNAAFVALDPKVYSADVHQVQLGLPSASGGLTVPQGRGPTLTPNPFFEVDAAGWTGTGGTVARSTVQAHEGVASLLLTPDGVTATVQTQTGLMPTSPGAHMRATPWVRCAVDRNVDLVIGWNTAGGAFISSDFKTFPVTANTWTQLTFTGVAPDTAGQCRLLPARLMGTPPASHIVYIDEAEIFTLDTATAGLALPATVGAVVTAGRATAVNAGTATAGLRLRVDGPVQQPRVSLLDTGGVTTLRLALTLTSGQWVDVDTAARTVYLNGTASRRGAASGGWPVLGPGGGEVAFDAAVFDPAASLSVSWRDAWV
jgi:hypothetical protein